MKSFLQFTAIVLFCGGLVFSSHAGFSSIYIWGDSLSSTTNDNLPDPSYYGLRDSNGRVWVEVLAQRQGLGANSITNVNWDYSSNNLSYWYHLSSEVVTNVNYFSPPANATNCLFVLWVNNADFVDDMLQQNIGDPANAPDNGTNIDVWNAAINQHLANHYTIVTNLYARGCRALVAPNAANIMSIPQFSSGESNHLVFVRQRIMSFNTNFVAMLKQIAADTNHYPGLTICVPDIFNLLDNVLTNAAAYGLTNALDLYGNTIDAQKALNNPDILSGLGTNYIFWDYEDPTAKMSEVIADAVQQSLSPVRINDLVRTGGSNRLDVVNMPVGMNGYVLSATNLAQKNWLMPTNFSFTGQTTTQPVSVPVAGPQQFYRLNFPWQWTWP